MSNQSDLAKVEINEALSVVDHKGAEVTAYNPMPGVDLLYFKQGDALFYYDAKTSQTSRI